MKLAIILTAAVMIAAHPADVRDGSRAAPSVIVFTGGSLRTPVVLSDWNENLQLMTAAGTKVSIPDTALTHRQKIDVAMFWGATWSRYAATPESLLARARDAQSGAYYPASHGEPALWIFGAVWGVAPSSRLLGRDGVAILRAHHLPVSVH